MRPDQVHSYLMQILHETENQLEYQTMLRFVWNEFFAYQISFLENENDSDLDYMQEFEKTVRLWQKVQIICKKSDLSGWEVTSFEKLHHWLVQLIDWLIKRLCDAEFCPTFREGLRNYKKILKILQKPKNAPVYQTLYRSQKLFIHQFQQTYLQDQETCLRDSYRILSDLETEYLPEDFAYNTIFCELAL